MRVLVTGATAMVGDFLLPMLVGAGHRVVATSRRGQAPQAGVEWRRIEMGKADCFRIFRQ